MAHPFPEQVTKALKAVEGGEPPEVSYSLETLVLLINTERLNTLKEQTRKELNELKVRQEKVRHLHQLLRNINNVTDEKGKFNCANHQEIKDLLKKAKELGVELNVDKHDYSKDERDRLVENLRIAADDYNVENDMQLQTISRLTNERYESYQMARSILKPLHEDKQRKAREISGRS